MGQDSTRRGRPPPALELCRSIPKRAQRARVTFGFDPVGRLEVMPFLEHIESEVGEDPGKSLRDLCVVIGVALSSQREQHRPVKRSQTVYVECATFEFLDERLDPGRTRSHPRWRTTLGWRRGGDPFTDL